MMSVTRVRIRMDDASFERRLLTKQVQGSSKQACVQVPGCLICPDLSKEPILHHNNKILVARLFRDWNKRD